MQWNFVTASYFLILNDVNHFKSYSNEFYCIRIFVFSFFVITLLPSVLRIFYCCYAPSSSLECIFEENIKKRKRMRQNAKNGRKKRGHAAIVWIESYDKKQQTTYDAKKSQLSGKPVVCNYLTVLSEFIRKIQRGKETIWYAINSVLRHREYLEHLIWIWY
jgi:hypothetical protein